LLERRPEVIVVGAGVVGASVAYYLSQRGARVSILERDSIGSGASGHATGSLSLLGSEFNPGSSLQLGIEGYRMFHELVPALAEETGIDLLYQRRPALRLALDEEEVGLIQGMMRGQREYLDFSWIDGDEVRKLEPRLSHRVMGAAYQEESGQLDSYRLTLSLVQAAEKHGARLLRSEVIGLLTEKGRVMGVRTTSGELHSDMVVLAPGVWVKPYEEDLGFPIPVRPLKGERLELKYGGTPLPVLISSPKRGHVISRQDGFLSVGSTGGRDYDPKELYLGDAFDRKPTERARIELLQRALDVFPEVEDAELVQHLAGSRPLSADLMPIIGPVPGWEGVLLATGHGTKGVHLGPITGKIIANLALSGRPDVPLDMDIFLPVRFTGQATINFREASQKVEE
jgi:glycine oxidase